MVNLYVSGCRVFAMRHTVACCNVWPLIVGHSPGTLTDEARVLQVSFWYWVMSYGHDRTCCRLLKLAQIKPTISRPFLFIAEVCRSRSHVIFRACLVSLASGNSQTRSGFNG
jgi:hypothetical protein